MEDYQDLLSELSQQVKNIKKLLRELDQLTKTSSVDKLKTKNQLSEYLKTVKKAVGDLLDGVLDTSKCFNESYDKLLLDEGVTVNGDVSSNSTANLSGNSTLESDVTVCLEKSDSNSGSKVKNKKKNEDGNNILSWKTLVNDRHYSEGDHEKLSESVATDEAEVPTRSNSSDETAKVEDNDKLTGKETTNNSPDKALKIHDVSELTDKGTTNNSSELKKKNDSEITDKEITNNSLDKTVKIHDVSELTDKETTNNLSDEVDKKNDDSESTDKEEATKEDEEVKPKQFLKLVDINKLMDPKLLKEGNSVIVLSSDESDSSEKIKKHDLGKKPKQKDIEKHEVHKVKIGPRRAIGLKVKKSKAVLPERSSRPKRGVIVLSDDTPSSEDSSDEGSEKVKKKKSDKKIVSSTPKKPSPKKVRSKGPKDLLKKVHWDTDSGSDSSSSDSSDSEDDKTMKSKRKKSNIQNEYAEIDVQSDNKFKLKAYVPLFRYPCEKLLEIYMKNKELLEIKRLTSMESLKRKRGTKGDKDKSSSDSDQPASKKKSTAKKTAPKVDSEEEVSDASTEEYNVEKSTLFLSKLDEKSVKPTDKDEEMATVILGKLNSDSENSRSSDKEETEKNEIDKEKSDSKSKKKSKKNTKDTESGEDKDAMEDSDKESQKDQSENKDSDDEKPKKKKKDYKRDKLLRFKIDSTDSEEGLEKFNEKKKKKAKEALRKEKVKRRKNTITDSDSEKKSSSSENNTSENEQSENEKQDKSKKVKKKRIVESDPDSDKSHSDFKPSHSDSSSSDGEEEDTKETTKEKSKKRRRIKGVIDNSSDEDADTSTRKQIRKVLSGRKLAESTKKAEAEEKERKARISDKQKKYNHILNMPEQFDAKVDKVILDFDEETEEPLLQVDKKLVKHLKPHQAAGIQFMWNACFESLERIKKSNGSGCILAHCMGLGKTLQVVALTHTLLLEEDKTGIEKVLVVCPINTVLNWKAEYERWLPHKDDFEVYELVSCKVNERQYEIQNWHLTGGVLIIGYQMFRMLTDPNTKKIPKKQRELYKTALVDPGPDIVICDEGHLLKNEKTSLSIAMNRIRTLRRIVLTGTPLQNNMKEYYCMVQFIKPNLLGTYKEYLNRFVNPITNGQYTDSTPHDIQVMRRRSHVLHKLLDGVVQRRDYSVLEPYLPPKYEYVLFLSLTELQVKLYDHYLKNFARQGNGKVTSFLFVDFEALKSICTHPKVLQQKDINKELKEMFLEKDESEEGSIKDFIDDSNGETTPSDSSSNNSGDEGSGSDRSKGSGKSKTKNSRKHRNNRVRVTRAAAAANPIELSSDDEQTGPSKWWNEYCTNKEMENLNISTKLFLVFEILKECEQIGDKVLIFSQSLYSLDIIEHFLNEVDEATQRGETADSFSGSWSLGLDYFRLDGSSSCDNRAAWCTSFNDPKNTRARLFLISTRAGGLGINLIGANRVIIFDVSWNPSHDIQSIYRVYRFGQTKPCYIYRFVAYGTMEMKIYERQVTKQAISKRVIDEQQIDRHYNQSDLLELYMFEPKMEERPIPLVPKDVLLGELIQKYKDKILSYHEHQSLLENKQDEELNEEERKAAWEEFENEKATRVYNNFVINGQSINRNLVTIAIYKLVKKENPTWTDRQIQSVTPGLVKTLDQQVSAGELTLYNRIVQEINDIQAQQHRQMMEKMIQENNLRMMQEQALKNSGIHIPGGLGGLPKNVVLNPQMLNNPQLLNNLRLYNQWKSNFPGPSNASTPTNNRNTQLSEVIELND